MSGQQFQELKHLKLVRLEGNFCINENFKYVKRLSRLFEALERQCKDSIADDVQVHCRWFCNLSWRVHGFIFMDLFSTVHQTPQQIKKKHTSSFRTFSTLHLLSSIISNSFITLNNLSRCEHSQWDLLSRNDFLIFEHLLHFARSWVNCAVIKKEILWVRSLTRCLFCN